MKKCTDCVNFIAEDKDQVARYGRSVGAPICGAFGHVLSNPAATEDTHAEHNAIHMAQECTKYNVEVAPTSFPMTTEVFVAIGRRQEDPANGDEDVKSCMSCAHNLTSSTVSTCFGYPLSACGARGTLILAPSEAAIGCEYANAVATKVGASEFALTGRLEPTFRLPQSMLTKMYVNVSTDDPTTYESDREVTDEDRAMGVRAWRAIPDPKGEYPNAYLPIFDNAIFSEEELALIPKAGDDHQVQLYQDYDGFLRDFAVEAFELDETILLIGHPGTGKTERLRWVAHMMNAPFTRITFDGDTQFEDVFGKDQFHPEKGTFFADGPFTRAWQRPGVEVGDEYNLAPPNIREFLRAATDNSKQLVVNGHTRDRHPLNFLALTQNPPWDARNVGAQEIALADANRLTPIWVNLPPEAVERQIISDRCLVDGYSIPSETLDMLMRIASDLRRMHDDEGTLPDFWGVRQQIKVARKTAWYPVQRAFVRAALDFYEPGVRKDVLKVISSIAG